MSGDLDIDITFIKNTEPDYHYNHYYYIDNPISNHNNDCLLGKASKLNSNLITIKVAQDDPFLFNCSVCNKGIDICSDLRKAEYLLNSKTCSKKCKPNGLSASILEIQECINILSKVIDDYISRYSLIEIECNCICEYRDDICHCPSEADYKCLRSLLILQNAQNKLQNELLKRCLSKLNLE